MAAAITILEQRKLGSAEILEAYTGLTLDCNVVGHHRMFAQFFLYILMCVTLSHQHLPIVESFDYE